MNIPRHILALLTCVVAPAWAQSSPELLNLQVPAEPVPFPGSAPEPTKTSALESSVTTPAVPAPPYTYAEPYSARRDSGTTACDDKAYAQPQVHGSVGLGAATGSHESGDYQAASVGVAKALGSCDEPKGGVAGAISVERGNVNQRRAGRP